MKPGWVRLDTFFGFELFEIDYILKAIELVAKYSDILDD